MNTKYFITTLFAAYLFYSCNNNKRKIEVVDLSLEQTVIDTPPPPPPPNIKSSTSAAEDFLTFWNTFRAAVLNSDTTKIIELTEFPFQTRGPLDSDPIIKYKKDQFVHVFNSFLNQWNGQDLEGTTEMGDIKKTAIPNKTDIQADYTRIGNLVFKKHNKKWKLSFAYLNNETIELLENK